MKLNISRREEYDITISALITSIEPNTGTILEEFNEYNIDALEKWIVSWAKAIKQAKEMM